MLIVAPSGSTKDDTSLDAPIFSTHSILIGSVPTDEELENANMIAGSIPLKNFTGLSRQNTPIGDNFRLISIHFINTSFRSLQDVTSLVFLSPSSRRIIPNPRISAVTITWSIFASTIGDTKFDEKIFTIVSIRDIV